MASESIFVLNFHVCQENPTLIRWSILMSAFFLNQFSQTLVSCDWLGMHSLYWDCWLFYSRVVIQDFLTSANFRAFYLCYMYNAKPIVQLRYCFCKLLQYVWTYLWNFLKALNLLTFVRCCSPCSSQICLQKNAEPSFWNRGPQWIARGHWRWLDASYCR